MDILFGSTRICNEFCQLDLQLLDWFLLMLSTTYGESELSCNYNEIMRRYCNLHPVTGINLRASKERSLLLPAVGFDLKAWGQRSAVYSGDNREKERERRWKRIVPKLWRNPLSLNPKRGIHRKQYWKNVCRENRNDGGLEFHFWQNY